MYRVVDVCSGISEEQNLHFQGDFNLLHMNAEVDGKNEVYQLW
jgi:hypothetical protein